MLITKQLHPDAVQDCLNIHCASDYDPTFEDCSSFLRLLVAGYEGEELDTIPTIDLQGLALVATRSRRNEPKTTEDRIDAYQTALKAWDAEIEAEDGPAESQEQESDADAHGLHERFSS